MASSPKVKVKQGTVVGVEDILPNGTAYQYFKGIPYAVPPLGELRFKAPVPLEKFSSSEIYCTKEGNVAFQKCGFTNKIIGSEDCLFLNVYVPKVKSSKPLPVMVYLHGGGFVFGSGNSDYYNPLYLIQEGVVVVTLNYRLGILGFFALPEANIPGNAGLKDQRLAMEWVKENISHFNGDPNNITLFGHSAGGACAHLHLLSENSRKFFNKVLIQSGLGTMPWAIATKPSEQARKLAQTLGCTSNDPVEIVKYMQEISDLKELIKPQIEVGIDEHLYGRSVPVCPVIEKASSEAVVPRAPLESMSDENSIDLPVMMGYTSAEGIVVLQSFIEKLKYFDENLQKLILRDIKLSLDDPRRLELAKSMREFYLKGEAINEDTIDAFNDILSDFFFTVHTIKAAEVYSRKQHKSPLFVYRFDYVGALNLYKKIFGLDHVKGVSHADELFYIFQATIAPEPWEEKAKKMVQTTCKLWTNFAKYSNPTHGHDDGNTPFDCDWEPVKKIGDKDDFTLNAFIIDEHQRMLDNPDGERVTFWKNAEKKYGTI